MSARKHRSELEISEDMAFQRRTWLVERVAWIVLGAILIAALLGFFGGGGPAASTRAATEDGNLSMQYERFVRLESPTQLRVVARSLESTLRLWLGREYVEAVEITSIVPQPDRVETAEDRYIFEFPVAAPEQAATVFLHVEPRSAWNVSGRLGVEGGGELAFGQFVYP